MRSVRLGRSFVCVLLHDAVSYMATRNELVRAIATAFHHTALGGVAMFQPDFVSETFEPGRETGGSDAAGRGLRYLEWRWTPEAAQQTYVTDMTYVLRDAAGGMKVFQDRRTLGLCGRKIWLDSIAAAGFEPLAVPFEHRSCSHSSSSRPTSSLLPAGKATGALATAC